MDTYRLFFLIFALLFASRIAAECECRLEFRAAAFFPSSKLFKDIYGRAGVDYQVQASAQFSEHFETWANIDWFSKRGKSIGLQHGTRIDILNCSLGVNFLYPLGCGCNPILYVGIGPSFGNVWIKKECGEKDETCSKFAFGGIVKAGMYYDITDYLFVDLFVDYLYQAVRFERRCNLSGFKTGVGLGVHF